jgi:CheY-like chemotaxis protein
MQSFQVLLVEDEPLLCRIIEEALYAQGFRVKTAQRGKEALELLETEQFDLIVLDVRLPDMSGLQILEAARQRSDSLQVLLVTAYESEITFALPPVQYVDAILFKPFDIDLLFSTVRQLVRNALIDSDTNTTTNHLSSKPALDGDYKPPLHAIVSLQTLPTSGKSTRTYAGRVLQGHETTFSVLTAPVEEPTTHVQVEYTESDGYYRFQTAVEEVTFQNHASIWLLRRPIKVQHLQRRKYSRLPATGHMHLLQADQRVLRVVQGDLLDISEGGLRVRTTQGLSKGMRLQAMVEWQDEHRLRTFEISGTIRHGFGQVVEGQMIFELGIAVDRMPQSERERTREKLIASHLAVPTWKGETIRE